MIQFSRWSLLLALVFAPWAYGSTRPWAVTILNTILGCALGAWLLGCLQRRRRPEIPRWLLLVALALVAQAWWMVVNAKFDYAPDPHAVLGFDYAQRYSLPALVDFAPGSYHKTFSIPVALQVTLLLGVICFITDLARRSEWRRRLLWTMGGTGVSLVLLGLAQRFTLAPSIFWQSENLGKAFFATYRYHGNAGAFINLIWPVLAGLLVGAVCVSTRPGRKFVLGASGILCLAGILVNTSRASAFLAIVLLGLWLVWLVTQVVRDRMQGVNPGVAVVTLGLLVLLSGGVAVFAGVESSLHRWSTWTDIFSAQNPRWLTAGVCWGMLPEAGWWGFGPGTFKTMFPYFTNPLGDTIAGVWIYAHEDYLQTLIEWGYWGGALWGVVVLGGILKSWRQYREHREELSLRKRALHFGIFTALLGVLLHALVDFPLQVASIQLYVAVLLGLLWGAPGWLLPRQHHHGAGSFREQRRHETLAPPASSRRAA